jgi:hypothetical protein
MVVWATVGAQQEKYTQVLMHEKRQRLKVVLPIDQDIDLNQEKNYDKTITSSRFANRKEQEAS